MSHPNERGIIANSDILSEDYLPMEIPGREGQIKDIVFSLSPVRKGMKPRHLWLYGKPGSGKTSTARFILKKMRYESYINGVYVNVWEHKSLYSVLDYLTTELRILRAEEQRAGAKLKKLEQHIGNKPFIIVLDEIDQTTPKERDNIIYILSNVGNIGIICISASREALFSLESRVKSRMDPVAVSFPSYSADDLLFILKQRAEPGLIPGTWSGKSLSRIAELADGDARVAIHALKNAAYHAEQDGSYRISGSHINKGWSSARAIKKTYVLRQLTEDQRMLYDIVKEKKEIDSGALWDKYREKCMNLKRKPIALRTFSEYMNRLDQAKLITTERARVKGKVRLFKVVG